MTTDAIPVNINVNHGVGQIDNVIGYPTKAWRAARKYSVNNTLPIAAVNAWLQFSLAYVAAIIITHNNLDFITNVFNPTLMSAYALVSVVLVAVFLTSLALKYMNKQEIKEDTKKEKLIDAKIRGGQPDQPGEISEIAEKAEKIEIIPNLNHIGHKKGNFSIVLPISEKKNKILENQKEENRNKIILLITIPSAISAAIIVGALVQNRFSFANIQGWVEISFISLVFVVAAVSICITLSKLRNNEINHESNVVKKFDNLDIIFHWLPRWLPFSLGKSSIVSAMKEQAKDLEENDPLSQLLKIARELKDEVANLLGSKLDKACDSFDTFLDETKTSIDKLLDSAGANIEKTLDSIGKDIKETLDHLKGIREDIKKDLGELHGEISIVLNDAKKFTGKINSLDIEGVFSRVQNSIKNFHDGIKTLKDKAERLKLSRFGIPYLDDTQSNQDGHESGNNQTEGDDNEFLCVLGTCKKEIDELKKSLEELKKSLKEAQDKQNQTNKRGSGCGTSNGSENEDASTQGRRQVSPNPLKEQRNTLHKQVEDLELQQEIEKLQEKKEKLEQKRIELPKQKEWEEKINGPASEFLLYLLEFIKLRIKDTSGEETDATLRNFDNKIIIHWKDGSRTTCYMGKDGNLQVQPNTTFAFVEKNTQAAFAVAYAG